MASWNCGIWASRIEASQHLDSGLWACGQLTSSFLSYNLSEAIPWSSEQTCKFSSRFDRCCGIFPTRQGTGIWYFHAEVINFSMSSPSLWCVWKNKLPCQKQQSLQSDNHVGSHDENGSARRLFLKIWWARATARALFNASRRKKVILQTQIWDATSGWNAKVWGHV